MKIDDLIGRLEKLRFKHGNCNICLSTPPYSLYTFRLQYNVEFNVISIDNSSNDVRKGLEVVSDYPKYINIRNDCSPTA